MNILDLGGTRFYSVGTYFFIDKICGLPYNIREILILR